jgi:hypothetical protein
MVVLNNGGIMQIIDIPEISNTLSKLRERFENFDNSGLYERYQHLVNSVMEWKISINGPIFQPLMWENEIVCGKTTKLVKKKYKNVEEAMYLGKYCSGFINEECVIVISPINKGIDARFVSFYERSNNALEEVHVDFRFSSIPKKRISTLVGLTNNIDISNDKRAKIGVGERGNFSVSLYAFSKDRIPIHVRKATKGYPEWILYFHYNSDGEMYKISTDELGKFIHWEKN